MIRAVLFDMDETLVENPYHYGVIRMRVQSFLVSCGVPEWEIERMGKTYEDTIRLSEKYGLGDKPLRYLVEEEVRRAHLSRPVQAAPDLLPWLKERGIKIAVITRNTREAAEIALSSLRRWVDLVLAREDVENAKPHPDHVLTALRAFGIQPREAIVVGDYAYDIESGKSAGCITVGINTDADYIISDLRELRALIENEFLREEGSSAPPGRSPRLPP